MKVVGFGAGGHAKVLIEALRLTGAEVVALTDAGPGTRGSEVCGVLVKGDDAIWGDLLRDGLKHAFIGLGGTGSTRARRALYERARAAGFEIIRVVHPGAIVSPSASIGVGAQILAGAIVNAGADIGENTIINTAAVVEHDCAVGAHAHVATGARLAGAVRVGEEAHVGIGASVRQGVHIGAGAIVGAGAAVVNDVAPGTTVVGVPARVLTREPA